MKADVSSIAHKADWAQNDAYKIVSSSKECHQGNKVSRAISMIAYGSQTSRKILTIRAIYTDATDVASYPASCTKEMIEQNFRNEVAPKLKEASYDTATFDELYRVIGARTGDEPLARWPFSELTRSLIHDVYK